MSDLPILDKWTTVDADSFWCDVSQHDHIIQVYENDGVLIDTLTGFIEATIHSNGNVVVIATDKHLNTLEARMESYGLQVDKLISENRFFPINVEELVAEFMVDDELDESLVVSLASELFKRAQYNNRKFKMFGEIAPTLMAQGRKDIAIKVERLFDSLIHECDSSLYCGYSRKLFNDDNLVNYSNPICNVHSKIISGSVKQLTHVLYRKVDPTFAN